MKNISGLFGLGVLAGCTFIPNGSDREQIREDDLCEKIDWFRDKDGDGFGGKYDVVKELIGSINEVDAIEACDKPADGEDGSIFVRSNTDCDDDDPNRHPDRTEDCTTSYDDDCDGDSNAYGDAINCTLW